jgi:PTH1 family peptidyl-tRNA hydrolase
MDAYLVMPLTYMNLSGDAVLPLARFLGVVAPKAAADTQKDGEVLSPGIPIPEVRHLPILVVYDDMDLDVGRLRIRPHGGAGGQKGMRSIIERLGTDRFPRLRVGIGRAGTDAARHVLSGFPPKERTEIDVSIVEAAEAITAWLTDGDLEGVMTRFHSRWNQDA